MRCAPLLVGCGLALGLSAGAFAQWGTGWEIPAGAETEASPLVQSADVLKRGKGVFERSCRTCHGPEGKGNGPNSDPRTPPADLTAESLIEANPGAVMFYRVWNGHPRSMPAFKSQLTRDDVWAVVEYVKTLANKP